MRLSAWSAESGGWFMKRKLLTLAGIAFISACPLAASAHHAFGALLDSEGNEVFDVIHGSVRVFRIMNPHGAMIVDTPGENDESEAWLIELSPASQLAREGWTNDMVGSGDEVSVAITRSRTPSRGRIRALLIHGRTDNEPDQLFVSYGIRGDTPVMRRLRERLETCGTIDQSYQRTECFLIDDAAHQRLAEEFPEPMGYVMP